MIQSYVFLFHSTASQFYLRSETFGNPGIQNPPRSRIEVDGIDYSKHSNGHNVVVIDLRTGTVESSVAFRTDNDSNAGGQFANFLSQITGKLRFVSFNVGIPVGLNKFQNAAFK